VQGCTRFETRLAGCATDLGELSRVADLQLLFLCVKTWALPELLPALAALAWPERMSIVVMMNGIDVEDVVAKWFDPRRVFRCAVNFAGNLEQDGTVRMNWFHPPNLIGPTVGHDSSQETGIARLLTEVGLATEAESSAGIKQAAFFKTVLNTPLGVICAVNSLTMAQAMRISPTRAMARQLLTESLEVAAGHGFDLGEDALDRSLSYIEAGGEHYPSMWVDLSRGNPTEIDFVNGKIVELAGVLPGVDVSLNRFFTSTIIAREIASGSRAHDDVPAYLLE